METKTKMTLISQSNSLVESIAALSAQEVVPFEGYSSEEVDDLN